MSAYVNLSSYPVGTALSTTDEKTMLEEKREEKRTETQQGSKQDVIDSDSSVRVEQVVLQAVVAQKRWQDLGRTEGGRSFPIVLYHGTKQERLVTLTSRSREERCEEGNGKGIRDARFQQVYKLKYLKPNRRMGCTLPHPPASPRR